MSVTLSGTAASTLWDEQQQLTGMCVLLQLIRATSGYALA
jgi:hypothetical protein